MDEVKELVEEQCGELKDLSLDERLESMFDTVNTDKDKLGHMNRAERRRYNRNGEIPKRLQNEK